MATAAVRQHPVLPPPQGGGSFQFQKKLAEVLAEYMAGFNLLGRLHVLQMVKRETGLDLRMNTLTAFAELGSEFTDVLGFERVPPEGALSRLRNLTSYTRAAYDALAERYKMQAFTVAGVTDVRLLDQIQQILIGVVEQGRTGADFERAVNQTLSREGVEQLTRFHLDTVFNTNVFTAYQNGRFEQLRDPAVVKALPYWKYLTVGDDRVRPTHAAMDGFVARQDDPVWRRWYPPAGFNCRCTVVAILPKDAPDDADQSGLDRMPAQPDEGFGGLGGIV
jgi:SPP1 gp7 family putative phage head morphogenesis protein